MLGEGQAPDRCFEEGTQVAENLLGEQDLRKRTEVRVHEVHDAHRELRVFAQILCYQSAFPVNAIPRAGRSVPFRISKS